MRPILPHGQETGTAIADTLGHLVASKAKLLGTIEADNAGEAVKKAAEEFKRDAWSLIAGAAGAQREVE